LVRDEGRFAVEAAVAAMTSQPAQLFGLRGRGTLSPGAAADICVIDLAALEVTPTVLVDDLPGGARRLQRGAVGYRAVMVNGVTVVADDRLSGRRPGSVLRRGPT
jgi:N-acyl-D-aspartate/D-glutamate deacylase